MKIFKGERLRKKYHCVMQHDSASWVSTGINLTLTITITGTSIGGLIAEGLDRADGRNNNYVFR